jgi:hypothetical protein
VVACRGAVWTNQRNMDLLARCLQAAAVRSVGLTLRGTCAATTLLQTVATLSCALLPGGWAHVPDLGRTWAGPGLDLGRTWAEPGPRQQLEGMS